jgi:arylsulfatase A
LNRSCAALIILAALFSPPGLSAEDSSSGTARSPNVVLIVADDLGFGDIGTAGSGRIKTPNLDTLARSGIKLTSFYSSANVCTPSRTGILTGRYAIRAGLAWKVLGPNDTRGLSTDETTISSLLKGAGYATAAIGKWHLGDQPDFHPFRHGFDVFYGVEYSNDMRPFELFDGEEMIENPVDQSTLTARYTARAIEFIRENADRPFFLYLPHTMPHIPLFASDKFAGRSDAGLYGDVVEEIDWSTGEIVNTLRDLGIRDNTLVIFTSDNGPWFEGSTGPARDRKGGTFGGGYRVPMIASWPERIPAASVSAEMGMNIDFLPTIAEVAGIDLPEDLELDGRSLLPILGGDIHTDDRYLYFFDNEDVVAIRDRKWKLVTHAHYRTMLVPLELAGPAYGHPGPYLLLFDMEDPEPERYSLARDNPEVVERLRGELKRVRAEFGAMRTQDSTAALEKK